MSPFIDPAQKVAYDQARYKRTRPDAFKAIKERQMRLKIIAAEGKVKPCMDCSQSYPPYVMDYDHRDPTIKVWKIANMVQNGVPEEVLRAEIAKCDVVCSNCHRIRTWKTKHWTEL